MTREDSMEFYRESHYWHVGQNERLMCSGNSHNPSVKHPEVWGDLGQVCAFPPMYPHFSGQ